MPISPRNPLDLPTIKIRDFAFPPPDPRYVGNLDPAVVATALALADQLAYEPWELDSLDQERFLCAQTQLLLFQGTQTQVQCGTTYEVLFAFEGQSGGELSCYPGEQVLVIDLREGWALVKKVVLCDDGHECLWTGLVPEAYLGQVGTLDALSSPEYENL